jgi:hypothetical protein
MVFNATFRNISAISWRSVLLVEETTDLPPVIDEVYHIMLYRVRLTVSGIPRIVLDVQLPKDKLL